MTVRHVPRIRVLISSTVLDLAQYRLRAREVIERVGDHFKEQISFEFRMQEDEPQTGTRENATDVSGRWADEDDWLVMLVAYRYGEPRVRWDDALISLTEYEYRTAMAAMAAADHRRVFIYVPAEGAGQVYAPDAGEHPLDAAQFRTDLGDGQRLQQFKQDILRCGHAEQFTGLNDFERRLERALNQQVLRLLTRQATGPQLVLLIRKLTPEFKRLHEQFAKIDGFKSVHDSLHSLLQKNIRPLMSQVVRPWVKLGKLSAAKNELLEELFYGRQRWMGQLEGHHGRLSNAGLEAEELKFLVGRVLDFDRELPIVLTARLRQSPKSMLEMLDELERKVDSAFRQADRCMETEEQDLQRRRDDLRSGVERERRELTLSPAHAAELQSRLDEVHALVETLQSALIRHHRWQEIHNELPREEVGKDRFTRDVAEFSRTRLSRLERMVSDAMAGATASAEAQQKRQGSADLLTSLVRLREACDLDAFERFRGYFDAAFYEVDKETLNTVQVVRQGLDRIDTLISRLQP